MSYPISLLLIILAGSLILWALDRLFGVFYD